ncbi:MULTISPECIES: MaoC/PaaZ C-terminal domain-containing protein [Sporosarcina]|uniref:MaoC/PaaZ C-terminal domain-containing protein n=1 Tax=Sporosarcina TaxID=1569 RepID=UPI00058AFD91|nr:MULTISPECIES: MaoC/PaaZ C-terminal domain-containing protein [Sporosarcina]WJY27983.1 MaoC/PaaZ C-terminal domain-containing protein [Sporosarcina sp. 0.2-SM1T-5]
MILGKKRRVGRAINEIKVGEKLKLTEKIEDRDLLLYLGLTNDPNPIYIQHDFASQTDVERPIVPTLMLTGILTSAISKYLPGPGTYVQSQHLDFPVPLHHYETIEITLEIIEIDTDSNQAVIHAEGRNEAGAVVVEGRIAIVPPALKNRQLTSQTLDNF